MRQRSRWVGIGAAVLGLTLSLAPLTAASAKSTKTKGSARSARFATEILRTSRAARRRRRGRSLARSMLGACCVSRV